MQKYLLGLWVGLFLVGAAIMDAKVNRGGQETVILAATSAVEVEVLD